MDHTELLERMKRDAEAPADGKATPHLMALADELAVLAEDLADLEAQVAGMKAREKELKEKEIPAAMADARMVNAAGLANVSLANGGSLYLATKTHYNVKAGDRPAVFEFLKQTGNGALVVEWVFPQTLTATLRAMDEAPDGPKLPACVQKHRETAAVYKKPAGKK